MHRRRRHLFVLLAAVPALALVLVCAVCAPATPAPAAHRSILPSPAPSVDPLASSQPVQLHAPDGITLEGRLFGSGDVGIVLAHYAKPQVAQGMWFPFAQVLRMNGYRALTFNFRGYCPGGIYGCSGGTFDKTESWRDIALAADFLRAAGIRSVFVMGAGIGGHSCLWAAAQQGVDFAGVVSVSTPQVAIGGPASYDLTPAILATIAEPKLFVAGGLDDAEAKTDAQSMYEAAPNPKQLALLDSSSSGPDLFSTGIGVDYVQNATQVVLGFLGRNSSGVSSNP